MMKPEVVWKGVLTLSILLFCEEIFLTYVRNNMHILLTYVKNNVYNSSYGASAKAHKKEEFSMARPAKKRRVCKPPKFNCFTPVSNKGAKDICVLEVDEYECIRLIDYEGQTQEECARQMNLVRTSVTAIYARARQKIADCLVNGKELWIEGGNYEVCEGNLPTCTHKKSAEKCRLCEKEKTLQQESC